MTQCLSDATWQKQHRNDAPSTMTRKAALVETMSYGGQANGMLLDGRSLSHLGHRDKKPKYPFEPLLDDDFITDSDNYLEDFINASDIVRKLKWRYTPTTTTTTTTITTTSTTTTTQTTTTTTTTTRTTTTTTTTTTT